MNPVIKNIAIGTVVIVILFFGYRYFFVDENDGAELKVEPASGAEAAAGREFLSALLTLKSINFSQTSAVLSDPAFISLKDQSITLPPEPVGRPNPFLPIGEKSGSSGTSTLKVIIPPTE